MKYLLLPLCIVTTINLTAQPISFEIKGGKPLNILFVERKNLVTIKNLPANAKIRLSHGNAINIGGGQFYINEPYCNYPAYDTVTIYNGKEIFEKKIFKLEYNGAPIVRINGSTYCDSVKPQKLYKNGSITISPDSLNYRVLSFEFVFIPKKGDMVGPIPSNGGKLSSDQRDMANRMNTGGILYIENIRAECTSGNLPPFYKERLKVFTSGRFDY